MMGLHQNFPVSWGSDKMEGCSLELDFEGILSPLPTDLTPSRTREPLWSYSSQKEPQQMHATAHNQNSGLTELESDPAVRFSRSLGREKKSDVFELSLGYRPVHQGQTIDMKIEREEVVPVRTPAMPIFADAMTESPLPVAIFQDEDGYDEDYCFDELDMDEDELIPTSLSVGRTPTEEAAVGLQGLPLRLIKQSARSSRVEDVPEDLKYYGSEEWGMTQLKRPMDTSQDLGVNESKRARSNREGDQALWVPFAGNSASPADGVNELVLPKMPLREMNELRPLIDINHAIQEMPEDTAEAFKELFRLVGASTTGAPLPDETDSTRLVASDFQQIDTQRASANALGSSEVPSNAAGQSPFTSRSVAYEQDVGYQAAFSTRAPSPVDEIDAIQSVASNFQQIDTQPPRENALGSSEFPRPLDTRRENTSMSVIQVKQEVEQYPNVSNVVPIRPVGECAVEFSNRSLIVTALNTFEQVRRQILKDPSYGQQLSPTDTGKSQLNPADTGKSRKSVRADLKAAYLMRIKGFWLYDSRPIGDIQGVEVGDCFRYRMEMAVIGLHRAVQAGIAVVPAQYSHWGQRVASSVVIGVSDPYQDDNDMGDTVVYSGQGGLCKGKSKEAQDQELTRGNLALSNSFTLRIPVRLIRGHKEPSSVSGTLYSYDGLYQVVQMNYVDGVNGKKVYKFTMHRLPGQAPIRCRAGLPEPLGSLPQRSPYETPPAPTKVVKVENALEFPFISGKP